MLPEHRGAPSGKGKLLSRGEAVGVGGDLQPRSRERPHEGGGAILSPMRAQVCAQRWVITNQGIAQVTGPARGGTEPRTQAVDSGLPSCPSQPPRQQSQGTRAGLPRDRARSSQRDPDGPGGQGQTDLLEQRTRSTVPCSSPERMELEGAAIQAMVTAWPPQGFIDSEQATGE